MTTVAKEPEQRTAPADAVRVYLVPVEAVAEFHALMDKALEAVQGDSVSAEIHALWDAVNYAAHTFDQSKIVKAVFK